MATDLLRISGILPPITTPFDAAGELDPSALAENVERYNAAPLAGYVAFGSSGEAVHLDERERWRVLDVARRTAAPGRLLVAGVNAQSTRGAIAATLQAADAGADAALVITPYFYKSSMTQEILLRFFSDVADASPLPVLAYNIPQNTGVTLHPATLERLAQHPNFIGVKDSSGDLEALRETLRRAPQDFDVLVGNAGILHPALEAGAAGGILAVACVVPDACVELYEAVRAGDADRAADLQRRLTPLARLVTVELGVAGLKAACELAGYVGGPVRGPLAQLDGEGRARIERELRAAPRAQPPRKASTGSTAAARRAGQ